MQRFLSSIFSQFKEFFKGLTPARRAALMLSGLLLITSLVAITVMVSKRNYTVLFRNVPSENLPLVLSKLREKNIPFRIDDDGSAIAIPTEFVPAMQMTIMAEGGSERYGQIGLELFEKQDFGTTSYAQKINFQRALQGELTRAINTLDAVKQSKVMLALPAKKTFLEETTAPKASVVLDLVPGKTLSPEQIRGITFLVASSVEGLEADQVTVVDSRGKMLNKSKNNSGPGVSEELAEYKERTEKIYEERIESILSKVVGDGLVVARVTAEIDHRNIVAVEETVDPDRTAIRSISSEEEKLNGNRTNPVGVPGARANLPGAQDNGEVAFRQDVNKESKTTNFEVPKTVKNIKEGPGRVERISVAVLVDGVSIEKKGADGATTTELQPRSAEELQKYESLIKSAIGFNEKRGDSVKVESIAFKKEDFSENQQLMSQLERRKLVSYLIKWGVIGFSLALFFLLVVRPFMRWITDSFRESVDDILPRTIEELEELQGNDGALPGMTAALPMIEESIDPDKAESELLKDRIMSMIEKNNQKAASALSLWLVRKD